MLCERREQEEVIKSLNLNKIANATQLTVALCCAVLSAAIYPGIMVVIPVAIALIYIAISILAIFGSRIALWISYSITLIVSLIFIASVNKFIAYDFQYFEGNGPQSQMPTEQVAITPDGAVVAVDATDITPPPQPKNEFRFIPYAFLSIAFLASFSFILKILGWYQRFRRNRDMPYRELT